LTPSGFVVTSVNFSLNLRNYGVLTSVKVLDIYTPLVLPPILHELPVNYKYNLPRFDGENVNITAEKNI
jgi:hypothetical protein